MSASPSLSKKLAAEALGTFVFVLVGAGSAVGTASLAGPDSGAAVIIAALANGIGLAVAVSATMSISGGALNPALVIGLLVGNKMKARDVGPYIAAELAGAVAAGIALVATFPPVMGSLVHWGSPSLNSAIGAGQGMAIEALLTFFLMFAVYGTAVDPRAPKIGGLGIGLTVLAGVLVGGNFTGAAMNPARAFGPMIAAGFYPGYWYIYAVGPVIGAIVAGLAYRYLLEQAV